MMIFSISLSCFSRFLYFRMISADLVTAAVLISFGVAYGFVSPCQIILICLIEPLAMKINEHIVVHFLSVSTAFI